MLRIFGVGRPTKLDDLTAKRILDAAAAGVSRRGAAEAAHVDVSTLTRWLQSGREGEEPYCGFRTRLLAAEAKAERRVVDALMVKVDEGNVPAMTLWLQQRRMDEWGKREMPANDAPAASEAGEAPDLEVARSVVAALESRKSGS
jgi:hypothetical protein